MEDAYWEVRLAAQVDRLLRAGNEDSLTAALDLLYKDEGRAYEELADVVEARTESGTVQVDETDCDFVLIAAPVLAWSRFAIPTGAIGDSTLAALAVQLSAHVLAKDVRLALANFLFGPDQLPRGYVPTYALASELVSAAVAGRHLAVEAGNLPSTNAFLADTRYLVGVAVVPRGAPLFRWQEEDGNRDQALAQWREQGGPSLQPMLTGCAHEILLPDAYFSACRAADRFARPYSIKATVAFLQLTLELEPGDLRAVIAGCYDTRLEEYRVAFTRRGHSDVLHGVVWPLLEAEDENTDTIPQIESVLNEVGVRDIRVLDARFPMEFCEDCGAPLYPDPEGEVVHAELPEESEDRPPQLH